VTTAEGQRGSSHHALGEEKRRFGGCSRIEQREVVLDGDRMKMDGGDEEKKTKEHQRKEENKTESYFSLLNTFFYS
jgi:hypothetical protein